VEIMIVVLVGVAAVGAVLYPLLRADSVTQGSGDMEPLPRSDASAASTSPDESIQDEVASYREALRAGTVCDRCLQANPEGSRFCCECGRQLGKEPVLYGEGDM
jgi:hypothetical protein